MPESDRSQGNRSNQQQRGGNQRRNGSNNRPWAVLYPRNYQVNGEDRTEFLRVGAAWPLKDKPGYRIEILGQTYIIMPQADREPGGEG